jgi:hypothetical protein
MIYNSNFGGGGNAIQYYLDNVQEATISNARAIGQGKRSVLIRN